MKLLKVEKNLNPNFIKELSFLEHTYLRSNIKISHRTKKNLTDKLQNTLIQLCIINILNKKKYQLSTFA